jgi:hypothetical protein
MTWTHIALWAVPTVAAGALLATAAHVATDGAATRWPRRIWRRLFGRRRRRAFPPRPRPLAPGARGELPDRRWLDDPVGYADLDTRLKVAVSEALQGEDRPWPTS